MVQILTPIKILVVSFMDIIEFHFAFYPQDLPPPPPQKKQNKIKTKKKTPKNKTKKKHKKHKQTNKQTPKQNSSFNLRRLQVHLMWTR